MKVRVVNVEYALLSGKLINEFGLTGAPNKVPVLIVKAGAGPPESSILSFVDVYVATTGLPGPPSVLYNPAA